MGSSNFHSSNWFFLLVPFRIRFYAKCEWMDGFCLSFILPKSNQFNLTDSFSDTENVEVWKLTPALFLWPCTHSLLHSRSPWARPGPETVHCCPLQCPVQTLLTGAKWTLRAGLFDLASILCACLGRWPTETESPYTVSFRQMQRAWPG